MTAALTFALLSTAVFVVGTSMLLLVMALWMAADEGSVAAGATLLLLLVFGLSFFVGWLGAP